MEISLFVIRTINLLHLFSSYVTGSTLLQYKNGWKYKYQIIATPSSQYSIFRNNAPPSKDYLYNLGPIKWLIMDRELDLGKVGCCIRILVCAHVILNFYLYKEMSADA